MLIDVEVCQQKKYIFLFVATKISVFSCILGGFFESSSTPALHMQLTLS